MFYIKITFIHVKKKKTMVWFSWNWQNGSDHLARFDQSKKVGQKIYTRPF